MTTLITLIAALAQSAPVVTQPPAAPTPPSAPGVPGTMAPSASPVADAAGNAGIAGLVAPDARPDLVIKGLMFAEGPASDAFGETYFCDMSGTRVYRIVRGASGIRADVVVEDTSGCSGLAWSREGRLYSAQNYTGRIVEVVLGADGAGTLRGIVETYGGEPRAGANDLVIQPDGGIWFTNMGNKIHREWGGVYFTTTAGAEPVQVKVPLERPNGIRLSPDGLTLYVADYMRPFVWSFPVQGPGKLGEGRVFASLAVVGEPGRVSGGDGMTVDRLGNVWVAVPSAGAIVVFDSQGKPLGRVMLPESPSNCAFGGADGRTLYVTARSGIYALPTIIDGYWCARRERTVTFSTSPAWIFCAPEPSSPIGSGGTMSTTFSPSFASPRLTFASNSLHSFSRRSRISFSGTFATRWPWT